MMMKNENIILIGMAGAGKSTLGVLLAKALGMDFVDTDILIQQNTKKLLQEIIETEGVERFMEIEEEVSFVPASWAADPQPIMTSARARRARGKRIFFIDSP